MPALPQPKARVEYKRPGRLNVVSVSMALLLAACGYVAHGFWPIFMLRSNVRGELADALPDFWRANLRPDNVRNPEMKRIKKMLGDRLRKRGVTDPNLEIRMQRSTKSVAIEARFIARAKLAGWNRTFLIPCAPRIETDAARVEW